METTKKEKKTRKRTEKGKNRRTKKGKTVGSSGTEKTGNNKKRRKTRKQTEKGKNAGSFDATRKGKNT
jgi:hypothetical protein